MKTLVIILCLFLLTGCIASNVNLIYKNKISYETINISTVWIKGPNTAGGVDIWIQFTNLTSKTIKYIIFYVTAYNNVDDEVYCVIRRRHGPAQLQMTGPFKYNETDYSKWEAVWYNNSIKYANIEKIKITYLDDTKRILSEIK